MGLLSFLKRKVPLRADAPANGASAPSADAVQEARRRARRRLIGATVLLGIGVIGFPLLFETQPRPIAVDIPIEIPAKEGLAPLAMPASRASAPAAAASIARRASPAVVAERAGEQGREVAPGRVTAPAAPVTMPATTPTAASVPAPTASATKPAKAATVARAASPADDGAKARSLLDGKSIAAATVDKAPDATAGRFVVQVGAFAEAASAREARMKVEKLGLKTYTQVVEVDGARRIRVRAGPFPTREEADRAAGQIKSAGLPAEIRTP